MGTFFGVITGGGPQKEKTPPLVLSPTEKKDATSSSFVKTQTRADGGSPFGVVTNKGGRVFSHNQKMKSTSKRKDSILFLPKHASLPYSLARILHGIHFQS